MRMLSIYDFSVMYIQLNWLNESLDERFFYTIFTLVNYNYDISKKGILGFSLSYLVLKIFRYLTYVN